MHFRTSAWLLLFASAPVFAGTPDHHKTYKPGLTAHYFLDAPDWNGNWPRDGDVVNDASPWTFRTYLYSRSEPLINHLFVRRGWFSVRWVGYLTIPERHGEKGTDGQVEVTFEFWADDGARLWLGGEEHINDWQPTWELAPESHRAVTVKLAPGRHRIVAEYFQGESLGKQDHDPAKLYWTIPARGIKRQIVPAAHFSHTDEDATLYVPSQGLSPADHERLDGGDRPPEDFSDAVRPGRRTRKVPVQRAFTGEVRMSVPLPRRLRARVRLADRRRRQGRTAVRPGY